MILIISDKSDKHADRVESILQRNAAEYSRLNLDVDSLKVTKVRFEDGSFKIETPNCSFSTKQIEAVWNRSTKLENFIESSRPRNEEYLKWKEKWNKTLDRLFSTLETTKWLNFYTENRFSQYAISKNIGLKWPSYICSNDINYLNSFFENKRDHILKLMDQDCPKRSVEECSGKCGEKAGTEIPGTGTENICPIAGTVYHVRCSIVGKEYFVGKIISKIGNGNFSSENSETNFTVIQPPKSIQLQAIQIMTELDLTHGVFDFFVNENDEWFFDALNPVGQYQWIEDIKGTDISLSIAKWLMINN